MQRYNGAMNDRAVRLTTILALVPFVVALFAVTGTAFDMVRPSFDPLRGAVLASTCVICITAIAIWRRYVRWGRARSTLTAIFTIFLLGHVIVWKPLWSVSGCAQEDILRLGQSSTAAGIWCAA